MAMKEKEVIHFYFGTDCIPPMGCCNISGFKAACLEWSDGRLACQQWAASTGEVSRFHELQQTYDALCDPAADVDDKQMVTLLLEIVQAYNDEYNRGCKAQKNVLFSDYEFFVRCILELQERGRKMLPASLKAELYREAGMFEKCLEFSSADCRSRDEKEIVDEVLFRAAHADTKPFIIEQCEYYSTNPRTVKRFPCPLSASYCIVKNK
jgi:hypothetical protein